MALPFCVGSRHCAQRISRRSYTRCFEEGPYTPLLHGGVVSGGHAAFGLLSGSASDAPELCFCAARSCPPTRGKRGGSFPHFLPLAPGVLGARLHLAPAWLVPGLHSPEMDRRRVPDAFLHSPLSRWWSCQWRTQYVSRSRPALLLAPAWPGQPRYSSLRSCQWRTSPARTIPSPAGDFSLTRRPNV